MEFHYYYLPDEEAEARIAADLAFTDRVLQEDGAIYSRDTEVNA